MNKLSKSDRAWPVPSRPWVMKMNWHDLLFMHYRVDPLQLRSLIPQPLEIDTFDGSAWLGIVPFRMTGVAPRFVPSVPGLSNFPELNVRTYVTHNGKPGVWFFSLEATNPLAVRFARTMFHLPYMDARINFKACCQTTNGTWIKYHSKRTHRGTPPAELKCEYRPIGAPYHAEPNSLASFLTARYCLYCANKHGRVYRGEIDHDPWTLRDAQAIVTRNTMTEGIGIRLPDEKPVLHYAQKIRAIAWTIKPIECGRLESASKPEVTSKKALVQDDSSTFSDMRDPAPVGRFRNDHARRGTNASNQFGAE
ncbi:MAG: DUF2071 domain-containing protein [Planctomycetota bacterium]